MGLLWRLKMQANLQAQRVCHGFFTKTTQDIFATIYLRNLWKNPESRSGWGSTLEGANGTQMVRGVLPRVIEEFRVSSIVDAGCGDLNWIQTVDLGSCNYLGIDVVSELVEENSRRFGTERRRFLVRDLVESPPPPADLVLVRDVLIHLSNRQVRKLLQGVLGCGATLLLISNYRGVRTNRNTFTGGLRLYNLYLRPFSDLGLPPPIRRFTDGDGSRGRELLLLDLRPNEAASEGAEFASVPGSRPIP